MIEPPALGPRLQSARKAQKLTLEQLAKRATVSRSMLSQIERGKANPTVATLWNIAHALSIDISKLLGNAETSPDWQGDIEHVEGHFTPMIRSPDGLCLLWILSPADLAGSTEWYRLEVAPGGSLESEPHAAGAREHLTVLTGTLEARSGDASQHVRAGETVRYNADAPHRIRNSGAETAAALLVVLS